MGQKNISFLSCFFYYFFPFCILFPFLLSTVCSLSRNSFLFPIIEDSSQTVCKEIMSFLKFTCTALHLPWSSKLWLGRSHCNITTSHQLTPRSCRKSCVWLIDGKQSWSILLAVIPDWLVRDQWKYPRKMEQHILRWTPEIKAERNGSYLGGLVHVGFNKKYLKNIIYILRYYTS